MHLLSPGRQVYQSLQKPLFRCADHELCIGVRAKTVAQLVGHPIHSPDRHAAHCRDFLRPVILGQQALS